MMEISDASRKRLLLTFNMRAIAAMDEDGAIGKGNAIPWNIPEEMAFFKKMTQNSTVLMGRKTFESIGRPLPNRVNIVLTSNPAWKAKGVISIKNIEQLFELELPAILWVCGGAMIYKMLLPACKELYLSTVFGRFGGDTKFPDFNEKFLHKETILIFSNFKIDHYVNKDLN